MKVSFDEFTNFGELKRWLSELPDQTMGTASAICETGEPYVEFFEYGFARPDDVALVERVVVERMMRSLAEYFKSRKGRIYWRKTLEDVIEETAIVVRYDENGPDKDFVTDRMCVKDRNWRKIACYCRLYRSTLQTVDPRDVAQAKAA